MSTLSFGHRSRPASLLAAAIIASGVTLLICLPLAPGLFGRLGQLLVGGIALVGGVASWVALPQILVALTPALIPSPIFAYTFAWELALIALATTMLLHGWRERSSWIAELAPVERALWLFTLWALFTGFWCSDLKFYVLGVRRLILGVVALWVAMRLPRIASRRMFDLGVIGVTVTLSLAAIAHMMTTGFSPMQSMLHRAQVTDLGWGTANYVASLLLLCAPSVLRLSLRSRLLERVLACGGLVLVTSVQLIVASRAAAVLFLAGALVQLVRAARRFRVWVGLGIGLVITILLASPAGSGLIARFYNLRDLGSMTIRIWYFREGWRRLLDHQPWGMGLGQGYANGDHLQGIDPHDYWLLLAGDLGVMGVLLWATVLVVFVRAVWALRDREQVHILLLTLTLSNLHTLVEPTFQGTQYQLLFYWVLGGTFAFAAAEHGTRDHEPASRAATPTEAAGALAGRSAST